MSLVVRLQHAYEGFALDVDLDLPASGVTAVFGHSGSGKTTLLRCVAGLEHARGRIVVNGETWQDDGIFVPPHRRALGYVFQDARLFAHLSVAGNLDYAARRARPGATSPSRAAIVDLLGIGHLLDRLPARLSGGEAQRVAIARALLAAPRLLLLDEPLAALDHARKQEILPYLERLRDELRIPSLYVTHAPAEVARLADHIVMMEAGRALAAGPLTETLARLDLPIRLGEDVGTVFACRVVERDESWHLARVAFDGGELWVRDIGIALGATTRVRILARDVSISRESLAGTSSINNAVACTIVGHAAEDHPALVLLQLRAGSVPLLARLTRRSAQRLGLVAGQQVWAQIKSVALVG